MIYIYGFVPGDLGAPPGSGLSGEEPRSISCGKIAAVVGDLEEPPSPTADHLRTHDRIARRLSEWAPAFLPARFGQTVPDEGTLEARVGRIADALGKALDEIEGCAQMTLRLFGDGSTPPPGGEPVPSRRQMTGTAYLLARRREAAERAALPEARAFLASLRDLTRAERVERHDHPPLLASVYHLVERGKTASYSERASREAGRHPELRIALSGPWPAYAFGPEAGP